MVETKNRCAWAGEDPLYQEYHDEEWGVVQHDEATLFEMLILEGMQAGLSWITILRKRENYREAFDQFDINKILQYDEDKINELVQNEGIVRHRKKIESVVNNAKAFLKVQETYGSFDTFIWKYVNNTPIKNHYQSIHEVPANTPLSDQISKDLKKIGFKFVGTTIIYAYMQAIGMVEDHTIDCFRYKK